METKSNQTNKSEYYWYWKTNPDPFDESEDPLWNPYDLVVNCLMEEKYEKGIYEFDIDIGNNTYIMNLDKKIQFLKSDTFRQRPIMRAGPDEDIIIHRKNRFTQLIYEYNNKANNNLSMYEEKENLQTKLKVSEILGYEVEKNSEIYELFNQTICISFKICEELLYEFKKKPTKAKFKKKEEIECYIAEEIMKQAERFSKIDKDGKVISPKENIKNKSYIRQAEIYIKKLRELNMPLEGKLIHIYTLEGFLDSCLNLNLREGSLKNCSLHLYYILLQASIAITSKKLNHLISMKALETIGGYEYYKIYRVAKLSEKIILQDRADISNTRSGKFIIYNDFLSTTIDHKLAERFLNFGDFIEDIARVFYTMLIPKKEADANPNLICFIEEISAHKKELEVLLSSSTIFQIQNIEKKQIKENNNTSLTIDYYHVTLHFISNGFQQFDFIKYSSLIEMDLNDTQIGNEEAKAIAESLKVNKTLISINLRNNEIETEGANAIAESLRVNTTLIDLNIRNNQIGYEGAKAISESLKFNNTLICINLGNNMIKAEGAKAIAEFLRVNNFLKRIHLENNQFEAEGVKAIAESLKVNTSLIGIYLSNNQIGDAGAMAIAECLRVNIALKGIDLQLNQIGNEGAKAIAESLTGNTALTVIHLSKNQIDHTLKVYLKNDKRIKIL